jgi:histidinol phosphatase-like enzyme
MKLNLHKKLNLCFDIDGVICVTKNSNYRKSKPIKKNIKIINRLYKNNFHITLFTARYMGRFKENISKVIKKKRVVEKQLKLWGVSYNRLLLGKPSYDLLIDDKALGYRKDWYKLFLKFL